MLATNQINTQTHIADIKESIVLHQLVRYTIGLSTLFFLDLLIFGHIFTFIHRYAKAANRSKPIFGALPLVKWCVLETNRESAICALYTILSGYYMLMNWPSWMLPTIPSDILTIARVLKPHLFSLLINWLDLRFQVIRELDRLWNGIKAKHEIFAICKIKCMNNVLKIDISFASLLFMNGECWSKIIGAENRKYQLVRIKTQAVWNAMMQQKSTNAENMKEIDLIPWIVWTRLHIKRYLLILICRNDSAVLVSYFFPLLKSD